MEKVYFYTSFKKFWVVEYPFPIVTKLNKKYQEKSQKYFSFQLYHIIYDKSL